MPAANAQSTIQDEVITSIPGVCPHSTFKHEHFIAKNLNRPDFHTGAYNHIQVQPLASSLSLIEPQQLLQLSTHFYAERQQNAQDASLLSSPSYATIANSNKIYNAYDQQMIDRLHPKYAYQQSNHSHDSIFMNDGYKNNMNNPIMFLASYAMTSLNEASIQAQKQQHTLTDGTRFANSISNQLTYIPVYGNPVVARHQTANTTKRESKRKWSNDHDEHCGIQPNEQSMDTPHRATKKKRVNQTTKSGLTANTSEPTGDSKTPKKKTAVSSSKKQKVGVASASTRAPSQRKAAALAIEKIKKKAKRASEEDVASLSAGDCGEATA